MNVIELQTVGSTNDYAKELAAHGAETGTVIWAHEQTAGRGRQGNGWVSSRGNLFMSVILRPDVCMEHVGQLSFLTAVALADVLGEILPASAQINLKWPNDLLINGKKAAGILIETESRVPWVIVGIGLNIASAPEEAVSLHDLGVGGYDAQRILGLLVQGMQALVESWEKEGFMPIRAAWLKRAYKLGEKITARLPKEVLTGIFEGVDAQGALQLSLDDGIIRTIHSGEVFI